VADKKTLEAMTEHAPIRQLIEEMIKHVQQPGKEPAPVMCYASFLEQVWGRPLRYSEHAIADAVDRSRAIARGTHAIQSRLHTDDLTAKIRGEMGHTLIIDDPFRFLGTGHLPMTLAAAHDVIDEQGPICKTSP
jgi:hypothetical protein